MSVNRQEIKRRRQALGMDLVAAAKVAGMNYPQQWQTIEEKKHKLRIDTLETVARVLQCTVADLLK